eukprot:m.152101 g.152101  ORF g.152101 m.152101 type:complete len:485 (+) comp15050_c0_seq2:168-1622(+)
MAETREAVAILDAGAQYGKLIDRRVRELNVCTELFPLDTPAEELAAGNFKAIIISGGPQNISQSSIDSNYRKIFELGVPVLGLCFGMQLANSVFGGTIVRGAEREDGQHDITVDTTSDLFNGLDELQPVLLTHGDSVDQLAPGFRITARHGSIISGIEDASRKIYAVQFHPEVNLTVNGAKMFQNFLFNIAKCSGSYTIDTREDKCIQEIKDVVGDKKVLVLVSGGVDSAVCAALLNKALGTEKVIALHINNGFMRKDESALVMTSLERLGLNIDMVDASEAFYNGRTHFKGSTELSKPLKEAYEPELKRNIIGDTFMQVANDAVNKLNLSPSEVYLGQGTLRPDLIESASKLASTQADAIKTHHNDTALVRKLRDEGRVVEPLKDYHKDEVRSLGRMLGLPDDLVDRQPFPGICACLVTHYLIHSSQALGLQFECCVHMRPSWVLGMKKLKIFWITSPRRTKTRFLRRPQAILTRHLVPFQET